MNRWLSAIAVTLCVHPCSAFAQETVLYYTTDAIGSVRMITNASGQVVERHDYLPFGEEYPLTQQQPSVEKRLFGGKEHDQETGFEYFGARYYAGGNGRFTSPDPAPGVPENPQTWNRYAYVLNNPLRYTDPTGLYEWSAECSDRECEENRQKFREAYAQVREAFNRAKVGSEDRAVLQSVIATIGKEGDKNGVLVAFDSTLAALGRTTHDSFFGPTTMTFNFGLSDSTVRAFGGTPAIEALHRASVVAHEGRHAGESWFRTFLSTPDALDTRAYDATSFVYRAMNVREPLGPLWDPNWYQPTSEEQRRAAIQAYIKRLNAQRK